jgi:hypothetical protein
MRLALLDVDLNTQVACHGVCHSLAISVLSTKTTCTFAYTFLVLGD